VVPTGSQSLWRETAGATRGGGIGDRGAGCVALRAPYVTDLIAGCAQRDAAVSSRTSLVHGRWVSESTAPAIRRTELGGVGSHRRTQALAEVCDQLVTEVCPGPRRYRGPVDVVEVSGRHGGCALCFMSDGSTRP
jgi:hypothetical protein